VKNWFQNLPFKFNLQRYILEQQVHALHTQLESTPEDIEMPDDPAPRW
jgi:hypothetical protein